MIRALVFVVLCASLPAAAQSFSGTYTARNPQGGSVSLTLKQDAHRQVTGTLVGNGATFQVHGEVTEDGLLGSLTGPDTRLYILAEHDGGELHVVLAEPNARGLPNLQGARELIFTRGSPERIPGPKARKGDGKSDDSQLSRLLTGNAWCSFTYNKTSGTSRTERVVFRPDGVVLQGSEAQTHSSGYGGSVAGQHRGGAQGRWRVAGSALELSEDGFNWQPQALQLTRNSNGYPILKSGGKEYSACN